MVKIGDRLVAGWTEDNYAPDGWIPYYIVTDVYDSGDGTKLFSVRNGGDYRSINGLIVTVERDYALDNVYPGQDWERGWRFLQPNLKQKSILRKLPSWF